MCLIVFAWKTHHKYPLILASNRDEFYNRPTSVAKQWEDKPTIWAGRDELAHGTWLGVNEQKHIAAVTNYRDLSNINPQARSRGELPSDFLITEKSIFDYMKNVQAKADQYNGFNLLTFNEEQAFHYSNYENKINELAPGIYGLSNATLNTPWPKVTLIKQMLEETIKSDFTHADLLQMMRNDTLAPDLKLPETGLSLEKEKALSAVCIRTEGYGTCCSTVITKDNNGLLAFTEDSYAVGNREAGVQDFTLK